MNESQQQQPITPDLTGEKYPKPERPERTAAPESGTESVPHPTEPPCPDSGHHPEQQQKPKAKPQRTPPRHKRDLSRRKSKRAPKQPFGPMSEKDVLLAEIDRLRSKRGVETLDAQQRVLTLKKFVQSHDLWEVFTKGCPWW